MKLTRSSLTLSLVAAAALALSACQSTPAETKVVDVYAAASLQDVFTTLGAEFEASHPGTTVEFSFAGSSDLATQIVEGAPADVFASANEKQMTVAEAELLEPAQLFATNVLTLVVAEGNPLGISGLTDLLREDVTTVVCAPQVPCGSATTQLFEAEGLAVNVASEEASVTDVLGKVAQGQADAGLVYVTDIARAEGVEGVDIPQAMAFVNLYPIGVTSGGDQPELAKEFVDFVLGERGQAALREAGFGDPADATAR